MEKGLFNLKNKIAILTGATFGPGQTIFDLQMDDFDRVTRLNLNGSAVPSLAFWRVMANQKTGVIINISSMVVGRALTRVAGYSASKAAVENFTRWLAVEMALKFGEGIRVNAIAPGFLSAIKTGPCLPIRMEVTQNGVKRLSTRRP